ncbi:phage tail protein [Mycobacterium paragordonae]|uniref:Tape measure protein n=1 Tax=Mycobacterium paragordonae TaxID=1389713 RepID=A0AAJ1W0K5_9MYCO|nr:hypothetical protein [Mycobacterium paragordonae]MDP7733638.1 hypothetical protein [Mycobacterium paragordonae]
MGAGGKEVGRISIRVVPELDGFRRKIVEVCEAVEKSVKVKIEVVPDLDGFREKVKAATEGFGDVEVGVDLDAAGAKAKMDALMAELRAKARDVNVDVDVDSGGAMARGAAGAAGGFTQMSQGLWIAAAVAAFAAPALALLSGALVTLPTLITATLVPIGAMALGLDGIKKAAEAAGLLGEGKKGKTTLGEQLKELQGSVSKAFQTGLTPVFATLTTMLPMLNAQLPKVATAMSQVAESFVNVITSGPGMSRIQDTIGNIAKAISAAAPGFANFADGFTLLIAKVSEKLPNMSTIFNKWGESFSGWVKKITREDWTGKSPLDRALHSFKETLQEILNLVGDLATNGFKFLSDPEFGKKMKEFVSDIKTLVTDVLPGLSKFFMDLTNAITGITNVIDKVNNWKPPGWLGSEKPTSAKPSEGVMPKMLPEGPENIKNALKALNLPLLIGSLIPWGTMWDGMVNAAQTAWARVKLLASTAWTEIKAALSQTGITGLWDTLVSSAQTAWGTVTAFVSTAVANLTAIGNSLSFEGIWNSLTTSASQAWSIVTSIIDAAISNFVAIVNNGVQQALSFFQALPGQIAGALAGAGGALAAAGQALMDGLLSGIKAGLAKVLAFASSIAGQIAAVKGPLPKDRTTLTPAGHALMEGLQDGIEGGLQGVLDRARLIAQQISEAIKSGGPIDASGLKRSLDEIDLERKQLKVDADQTTDPAKKAAIRDQLKQLQTVRDQLALQSEQLGFSKKYGDNQNDITSQFGQQASKMVDMAKGFATANLSQFQNDIGISGQGAVSQIADQGLSWATGMLSKFLSGAFNGGGTTINVGSVDEAIAFKRNQDNREALQYTRR